MKNNCETCEYKECEKYKENETKAFANLDFETFSNTMNLFHKTWVLIEKTSKFITPEIKDKLLSGDISMEEVLEEYEKYILKGEKNG